MTSTAEKDLQLVEETLSDIVNRLDRFTNALAENDVETLARVYAEETCAHMSLLPDIVKDAEVQVSVLESTTSATYAIKNTLEAFK